MKKFESKSDFKDRIASIAMGISVEEVVMNRGARISAAREKWIAKHIMELRTSNATTIRSGKRKTSNDNTNRTSMPRTRRSR